MIRLLFASILLLVAGLPVTSQAQDDPTFSVSGFVSATLFVQRNLTGFAEGPCMEWTAEELAEDPWFLGSDIGNTRLRFSWAGPQVQGDWRISAAVEADFYGFQGSEPFGDEQPNLRARLAFADISNGTTTFRVGQFWSPLLGEVPTSVSHLAFPLGYGSAGVIGWRYPGLFLYHRLSETAELQLALMEGSGWVPAGGQGGVSDGNASLIPQMEARLNLRGGADNTNWRFYVVGHIDRKDANGVGVEDDANYTGWVLQTGGQVQVGQVVLKGNGYIARAAGNQFAHITQPGDVRSMGGWLQGGIALNPHWSLWLFYGIEDPDEDQFREDTGNDLTRWKNQMQPCCATVWGGMLLASNIFAPTRPMRAAQEQPINLH